MGRVDATTASLMLVDWQVFGSATWRPRCFGNAQSREDQLWSFLKESTAEKRTGKFYDLPVVVRWEKGETFGRPHAHFLLAGLERVTLDWMFKGTAQWFASRGLMRQRWFGQGRLAYDTASYVLPQDAQREDRYELGKFSYADRLVINHAAWTIMCEQSGADVIPQHRTL